MATFCLIPKAVEDFKRALKSGEIDPLKLSSMDSSSRHTFLEKYVGKENSQQVNALFESKLLLKNQKMGYITWAKKVGGITKEARRDLIARIEKLDTVLSPKEETQFLHDLASTKLGTDITLDQAKTITDLSNKVKETQLKQKEDLTFNSESERLSYGKAKIDLGNYVNNLKNRDSFSLNPIKIVKDLPGITKSIRASMDNSAIFRQGWKTLMTNPDIWQKNARKTFVDMVRTFGGKKVMDEINADIVSRPNYERYVKAKLAVSTIEEAFPTSLPEKIPVLGRAYKASETAYTGFLYRQRADIFDKFIQIANNSGVDINNTKELQSIGSMVNSLTGRGNLGKYEPAANLVNNVFFSPRSIKANFDTFLHPLTGAGGSNFVRKQASINLLKVVTGTAAVLTVANALMPGSVETDPRSSDFGKIKVGDTRFDVTGGMSSLLVLASRLATMSSKSSTTGKVNPLNSGKFGAQTGEDVIVNFFENKLSPILSVVKDLAKGQDFNGNKPTIGHELENLFVPLSVSTYNELKADPNSADIVLSMIADGLGLVANTYGKTQKNWDSNPTKEQQAFKDKVGSDKFNQANQDFNKQYDEWFAKTLKTSSYKNLSNEAKQTLSTDAKSSIQDKVFKSYNFKYKTPKKTLTQKNEAKTVKSLTPK